jgi:hypothetical protein
MGNNYDEEYFSEDNSASQAVGETSPMEGNNTLTQGTSGLQAKSSGMPSTRGGTPEEFSMAQVQGGWRDAILESQANADHAGLGQQWEGAFNRAKKSGVNDYSAAAFANLQTARDALASGNPNAGEFVQGLTRILGNGALATIDLLRALKDEDSFLPSGALLRSLDWSARTNAATYAAEQANRACPALFKRLRAATVPECSR